MKSLKIPRIAAAREKLGATAPVIFSHSTAGGVSVKNV